MSSKYLAQFELVFVVFLNLVTRLTTNIAVVRLILLHFILFVSELGKCIRHETRDNITEERTKEHSIDNFIGECFEVGFIRFTLLNVDLFIIDDKETFDNGVAVFRASEWSVRLKSQYGEN
jgi:hypothetical protein